jgi:hypothetical protein
MWLSDSRIPRRSTPTVMRPTPVQLSSQRWRKLQLGLGGREAEEAEGGAEVGAARGVAAHSMI